MKLKALVRSNIGFIIIMSLTLLMIFSPNAKAWFFTGLMKIGLFQPDVKEVKEANNTLPGGIVFKDKDGQIIELSEQNGKVLFINFWATWCPPCIAEMPTINKLYTQFKDKDILFLMVDVDDNLPGSLKFIRENGYSFPVYTMASAIPPSILDGTIPTTLIINKQGKIAFYHKGVADYSNPEMVEFLKQALEE